MKTLLLDLTLWDLVLDVHGDIATATDPYAVAQDVASACRLFAGELYYDTTQGVVYDQILGRYVSLEFVKAQLVAAALSVPTVSTAVCYLSALANRRLAGQVQFTYTPAASSGGVSTTSQLSGTITITEDGGLDISL